MILYCEVPVNQVCPLAAAVVETLLESNLGWPGACHMDQSSFELEELHLALLPKCCDFRQHLLLI